MAPDQTERRLYRPEELPTVLQLSEDQCQWLTRTGQLNPLTICGETRYDSADVAALIETYKQVAKRKTQ